MKINTAIVMIQSYDFTGYDVRSLPGSITIKLLNNNIKVTLLEVDTDKGREFELFQCLRPHLIKNIKPNLNDKY